MPTILPKGLNDTVYVYLADTHEDGDPIFMIAATLDDIPDDLDDEPVYEYAMLRKRVFRIRRELHD